MRSSSNSTSRREFLNHIAITSVAIASGVAVPASISAAGTTATDRPKKLDLGITPAPGESSGVLFKLPGVTYIIFRAIKSDTEAEGTAVVELVKSCAETIAYPANDRLPQPGRPRFFGDLELAEIYELENSTWLAAIDAKYLELAPIATYNVDVPLKRVSNTGVVTVTSQPMTVTVPNMAYRKPSEDARHFAFTFRRSTVHCVADALRVDFRTQSLASVLAGLR